MADWSALLSPIVQAALVLTAIYLTVAVVLDEINNRGDDR